MIGVGFLVDWTFGQALQLRARDVPVARAFGDLTFSAQKGSHGVLFLRRPCISA